MNSADSEMREAILEGAGIELYPDPVSGYFIRVGTLDTIIYGESAAACFLHLADIVSMPVEPGVQ